MSKSPPIPPSQATDKGPAPGVDDNLQNGQPGNADVNVDQQGQSANTRQNTTHQNTQRPRGG